MPATRERNDAAAAAFGGVARAARARPCSVAPPLRLLARPARDARSLNSAPPPSRIVRCAAATLAGAAPRLHWRSQGRAVGGERRRQPARGQGRRRVLDHTPHQRQAARVPPRLQGGAGHGEGEAHALAGAGAHSSSLLNLATSPRHASGARMRCGKWDGQGRPARRRSGRSWAPGTDGGGAERAAAGPRPRKVLRACACNRVAGGPFAGAAVRGAAALPQGAAAGLQVRHCPGVVAGVVALAARSFQCLGRVDVTKDRAIVLFPCVALLLRRCSVVFSALTHHVAVRARPAVFLVPGSAVRALCWSVGRRED